MTSAKMGSARKRLVTTRSILSDGVIRRLTFRTLTFMISPMRTYRSLVTIDSLSSSSASSQGAMIASRSLTSSSDSTFSSRSNSFTA